MNNEIELDLDFEEKEKSKSPEWRDWKWKWSYSSSSSSSYWRKSRKRSSNIDKIQIGQIFKGRIKQVKSFGAFIEFRSEDDWKYDGLVHVS